ncbi:MAG: hypothetical protein ABI155_03675 [Paralcaligenes sp.]
MEWHVLIGETLHVPLIVLYTVAKGPKLLRPMITGRKRLPVRICAPRRAPPARALILLAISAAIAAVMANYL